MPGDVVEVRQAISAITEAARTGDDERVRALLAGLAPADTTVPCPGQGEEFAARGDRVYLPLAD